MTSDSVSRGGLFHHPRLIAYHQLMDAMQRLQARAGSLLWTGFLDRLPLVLGETTAERTVPYSLSNGVTTTFERGVDGLLDLLKRRADPDYDRDKRQAILPDERQRVTLWPLRFRPRTLPEDSPLYGVVRLALLESPDLDGGLLESWLARNAGGLALYRQLVTLVTKARSVAGTHSDFSGIPLMNHLALLNSLLAAKDRIKQASVRNMTYARLERTVGMGLHAVFSRAVQDALAQSPPPPRGTPEFHDLLIMLSSLGPLPFISTRKAALESDVNSCGFSAEAEDLLMPVYQSALERNNQPAFVLKECMRAVGSHSDFLGRFMRQASCEGFRRLALDHLLAEEDPASEGDRMLADIYHCNDDLRGVLEDTTVLHALVSEFKQRLLDRQSATRPMEATYELLAFLERVQHEGPPWHKLSPGDEDFLQDVLERFILHRFDEFATAHVQKARRRVLDRRRDVSVDALIQEYEAGRLYRIADDDQPLVKARVASHQGQLFVDLKGYTRRTARSKELVMAEFLKNEFYEPILEAAKNYHTAISVTPGEETMRLVNLLGDAVAFSGDIVSLLGLARDIQAIFRSYHHKLQELAPLEEENAFLDIKRKVDTRRGEILSEMDRLRQELDGVKKEIYRRSELSVNQMVQQLQEDYTRQFNRLQEEFASLQEQLQARADETLQARLDDLKKAHQRLKTHRQKTFQRLKTLGNEDRKLALGDLLCRRLLNQVRTVEERLHALEEEERNLLDALEDEQQLQLGSGLEAGLFITYGTSAEVIEIDDDIWGAQRVSISERINEAARGTARNPTVKRLYDDMLAAAQAEQSNPGLEFPFRVFIAHTRAFDLEPSLVRLWSKTVGERDPELLNRFIGELHAHALRRFGEVNEANGMQGKRLHPMNDIYNLGEALSGQALDAYLRQTRTTHFFFRVQARTAELDPALQNRFFFPEETLSLIVGRRLTGASDQFEIFRYVGQILFRGFEVTRPSQVFESLRPDSPFVRLLARHHLPEWFEEAEENPACKIEELGTTPELA